MLTLRIDDLEITRESLQQRYSDLIDAELLRRLRSGNLTDLAHDVALAELAQRGLSLDPQPAADVGAPPDPDLEFPPDEFACNPYQAPRSVDGTANTAMPVSRWRIADAAWFVYAAVFGLITLWDPVARWLAGRPAESTLELVSTGFALAALIAWRLRTALLSAVPWVAFLALYTALVAVELRHSWRIALDAGLPPAENYFLYATAAGLLLHLPMLWGLTCYAFASPSIWRRERGKRRRAAETQA